MKIRRAALIHFNRVASPSAHAKGLGGNSFLGAGGGWVWLFQLFLTDFKSMPEKSALQAFIFFGNALRFQPQYPG